VDGVKVAGWHHADWDGRTKSGERVSSGIYFYRLVSGDITLSRKMVMLK
jgi:hypothetical protein